MEGTRRSEHTSPKAVAPEAVQVTRVVLTVLPVVGLFITMSTEMQQTGSEVESVPSVAQVVVVAHTPRVDSVRMGLVGTAGLVFRTVSRVP